MADSLKLDRELYRRIKCIDKNEMSGFLERIYAMCAEDNNVDLELLRERIGKVKPAEFQLFSRLLLIK